MRSNFKKTVCDKTYYKIVDVSGEQPRFVREGEVEGYCSLKKLIAEFMTKEERENDYAVIVTKYDYGTYRYTDEIIRKYGEKIESEE